MRRSIVHLGLVAHLLGSGVALAQSSSPFSRPSPPSAKKQRALMPMAESALRLFSANMVVPQTRAFPVSVAGALNVVSVDASVSIADQLAATTLEVSLANPTGASLPAELWVPVPDGAAVRGFTVAGSSAGGQARLLPKDDARRAYDEVVALTRDPAILEFVGYHAVRSSLFPVDAGGRQTVRLVFEQLLPSDGLRVDYVLPRSESLEVKVPWKVSLRITSQRPIASVYSPSHPIDLRRESESTVVAMVSGAAQPGPLRVSYLLARDGVTASLFAYPEGAGGYFLLIAAAPPRAKQGESIRREVTLVIDRSGSMTGEKWEQVRAAARQILGGLRQGEAFNLICYNHEVDRFAPSPRLATPAELKLALAFLANMEPRGGTNIHDALGAALSAPPIAGALPIVLFMTDGLPTVGQTKEAVIRTAATKGNPHQRRIFTFGVGVDVNTALLEKLAWDARGTATLILPHENVEAKVSQVFRKLKGPVLAAPELTATGGALREVVPSRLPDLFEDDQLVVAGRYRGTGELPLELAGNYLGTRRTFRFHLDAARASPRHSFVPRLWASRRVGVLLDAIREVGADQDPTRPTPPADPRVRDLVAEVVRLSTQYGILTEYTAFLGDQETNLVRRDQVMEQAQKNVRDRALYDRSGLSSASQDLNRQNYKTQSRVNPRNERFDEKMNVVSETTVQPVSDLAFYRRGERWVDSRIVDQAAQQPKKVVEYGSAEWSRLLTQLADRGRQGSVALPGEVILSVDGEAWLVRGPRPEAAAPSTTPAMMESVK